MYLPETMPQTCEKLRLQIKLNMQNLSVCQIPRITKVHKSTLSRIIIRYNDRGHINNNKSPGRPKKVNERMERIVVRASKKDPFLNASQIKNSQQIDLCTSYIRKILIKYGFRERQIAKKPSISGPNRQKRKKWVKKMQVEKKCKFLENSRFFGRDYA